MDPMSLLLTALATGATAAAQDTTSQVIKDSYAGLKALILKRFAGRQAAETALTEYEEDEETWKLPLQKSLAEVGVDGDQDILQQAQLLLTQMNPQQASQGKYIINIGGEARGNVFGDNAQLTNTWND